MYNFLYNYKSITGDSKVAWAGDLGLDFDIRAVAKNTGMSAYSLNLSPAWWHSI